MHSVLRISGVAEQLEKLLGGLERVHPDLSPEINRRNDLVCNLSQNSSVEHWSDVADALDRVSESIAEAEVGDVRLLVNMVFDLKQLPDSGVAVDALSVSQIALEAMARIGADFEATACRSVTGDEV